MSALVDFSAASLSRIRIFVVEILSFRIRTMPGKLDETEPACVAATFPPIFGAVTLGARAPEH